MDLRQKTITVEGPFGIAAGETGKRNYGLKTPGQRLRDVPGPANRRSGPKLIIG